MFIKMALIEELKMIEYDFEFSWMFSINDYNRKKLVSAMATLPSK
jgi:hypothetical protein